MLATRPQGFFRKPTRQIPPHMAIRTIRIWINQVGYYDI